MQIRTSYLICATPRTGSYLLCEALKNTGLAGRPDEYFWRGDDLDWKEERVRSLLTEYVVQDLRQGTTSNGVFGAKVMRGYLNTIVGKLRLVFGEEQCSISELLPQVFPDLHYIFITRRDKVQQAVSLAKALQTKAWVSHPTIAPSSSGELVFDFQQIDSLVQQTERQEAEWQDYFQECGVAPFTVVYEDLVPGYKETAVQILEHLGIPIPGQIVFGPRHLRKQADALSEEWIQRYMQEKQARTEQNHPQKNELLPYTQ